MRRIPRAIVLVIGLILAGGAAAAAGSLKRTTDYSDLWWIPSESGWGMQLVQEETTIFATLFVYGPGKQPTWYTALVTNTDYTSHTWTGTLYATTGPWFGAGSFDPAAVDAMAVGTMTLDLPFVEAGTLTYTVNGLQIVKHIQRETLQPIDFNGSYSGVLSRSASGTCPMFTSIDSTPATWRITQSGTTMSIDASVQGVGCTYNGSYGQSGRFGGVTGNYTCLNGEAGTFDFFEMSATVGDFRMRTSTTSNSGCTVKGYAIGLVQPPPLQ